MERNMIEYADLTVKRMIDKEDAKAHVCFLNAYRVVAKHNGYCKEVIEKNILDLKDRYLTEIR